MLLGQLRQGRHPNTAKLLREMLGLGEVFLTPDDLKAPEVGEEVDVEKQKGIRIMTVDSAIGAEFDTVIKSFVRNCY